MPDIAVERNQMYGFIGAGKTTTMRIICGLIDFDAGECRLFGDSIVTRLHRLKGRIGYMPQRFSLYTDLSIMENLLFYADVFGVSRNERRRRIEELLSFSRLAPFKDRRAGQLSGGMKQKLALSCTLIHTPELLILDEPTTGDDPVSRREFWNLLKKLRSEGVTIVVSTPYMDEAALCDAIALFHKGTILTQGPPDVIPSHYRGKVFELHTADDYTVFKKLKESPDIDEVIMFGDVLHLAVANPHMNFDAVRDKLSGQGVTPLTFREIPPSLEDTLVQMIRETA